MSLDSEVRTLVREVVRDEFKILMDSGAIARGAPLDKDRFIPVSEAARIASVHPATVRGWIRDGKLPRYSNGRHHLLRHSDLENHLRVDAKLPNNDHSMKAAEEFVTAARRRQN